MVRTAQQVDDRAVVDRKDHGRVSGRRRRALSALVCTLAVALFATCASASAFSAHGSIEQVYITGLAPNAQVSLLNNGATVSTQSADALGGLLFRHVAPGKHYKVRLTSTSEESPPLRVYAQSAKPWNRSIYKQSIPSSGYGYLTTRDGTKLSIDVHPPTSPAGEPGLPKSV